MLIAVLIKPRIVVAVFRPVLNGPLSAWYRGISGAEVICAESFAETMDRAVVALIEHPSIVRIIHCHNGSYRLSNISIDSASGTNVTAAATRHPAAAGIVRGTRISGRASQRHSQITNSISMVPSKSKKIELVRLQSVPEIQWYRTKPRTVM